jgi:lipid II:glycine glycyltransferase (peptidoglycan interpeptide bridge formation enzyme)
MPQYLQIWGVEYGYLVEDGFVLPYFIEKRSFFSRLIFTTGVLGESKNSEEIFLNHAVSFIKKNIIIDFVSVPNNTALFNAYPANSIYCRFGSYIIDLTLSEEELFANIHSKHRNVIKKAQKDGVVISNGPENFDKCIDLIILTLQRQNMLYLSKMMYKKLSDKLGENIDFWVATKDGEVQGSTLLVWNKGHSAYYLSGGSIDSPHQGSMNLLHWEAIRLMKSRGVREYNFVGARIKPDEGSRLEGIQRFKSRFGGEMRTGYLWKMPVNHLKYKLYYLGAHSMAFLKRKRYNGDVIDQEKKFV